ncbi:hypothetical protein AWENTII_002047 [Aspergillus wentii]
MRGYASRHPEMTQEELRDVFEQKFGRRAARSSIGEMLRSEFDEMTPPIPVKIPRQEPSPQPVAPPEDAVLSELEHVLKVYLSEVLTETRVEISLIREVAYNLLYLQGIPRFPLSEEWMRTFARKYNFRNKIDRADDSMADVERALKALYIILLAYKSEDIFMTDHAKVDLRAMPGMDFPPQFVSALLCTNVDGSHRCPLFIVGSKQYPPQNSTA